jgi:hypothetical protein
MPSSNKDTPEGNLFFFLLLKTIMTENVKLTTETLGFFYKSACETICERIKKDFMESLGKRTTSF